MLRRTKGSRLKAWFEEGMPSGYANMADESGAEWVDESGALMIGQSAPAYSVIKVAAAARSIRFGVAAPRASLSAAGSLVDGSVRAAQLGWRVQAPTSSRHRAILDWNSVDDALAYSDATGMSWRLHLLNYPAHDMPWVDGDTVTSGTWQVSLMLISGGDSGASGGTTVTTPTSIDVTNELADGSETDGFARNAWYNAGGREAFAYMFEKARQLWPTTFRSICARTCLRKMCQPWEPS